MQTFRIRYYAGPYAGIVTVEADDATDAIAAAKAKVRRTMTLPMYADGYRVVGAETEED